MKSTTSKHNASTKDELTRLANLVNKNQSEGMSLIAEEKYQPALAKFNFIIQLIDNKGFMRFKRLLNSKETKAEALFNAGICHSQLDNFADAEYSFNKAIENNESLHDVRLALAKLLLNLKRYKEVHQHLNVLLKEKELATNLLAEVHYLMARAFEKQDLAKEEKKVNQHYQYAINLDHPTAKVQYNSYLAEISHKQGNFKKELIHLKQVIDGLEHSTDNISLDRVSALHNVGMIYINDCYEEQDYNLALEYFKKCIAIFQTSKNPITKNEAVSNAAYNVACVLEQGIENIPKDPEQSLIYFKIAAELGNPDSLYYLGFRYERGENVPRDISKAIDYYTKAAELNYAPAQTNLSRILIQDKKSDEVKIEKALRLLEKAVEVNYHPALPLLGYCHLLAYHRYQRTAKESVTLAEKYAEKALFYFKKGVALGDDSAYVLPNIDGSNPLTENALPRAISRIQDRVGIPNWRAHDLRRMFATQLGETLRIAMSNALTCPSIN